MSDNVKSIGYFYRLDITIDAAKEIAKKIGQSYDDEDDERMPYFGNGNNKMNIGQWLLSNDENSSAIALKKEIEYEYGAYDICNKLGFQEMRDECDDLLKFLEKHKIDINFEPSNFMSYGMIYYNGSESPLTFK